MQLLVKVVFLQQSNDLSLIGVLDLTRLKQESLALHDIPQLVVALRHIHVHCHLQIALRFHLLVEANRLLVFLL